MVATSMALKPEVIHYCANICMACGSQRSCSSIFRVYVVIMYPWIDIAIYLPILGHFYYNRIYLAA